MIFYKNVDIVDLNSILAKGILSLSESGNNNWIEGRRSPNSKEVVYLFSPTGNENSFPKYGVALLKVDILNAKEIPTMKNDFYCGKYTEYVVDKVAPEAIIAIYIPEIFKERITLPLSKDVVDKIVWCKITADHYEEHAKRPCPEAVLAQFAKTAPIIHSTFFNFFRGITEKNEMIDLYNINYKL